MKYMIRATYVFEAVVEAGSPEDALAYFSEFYVDHGDTELVEAVVSDKLDTPEKVERAIRCGAEDMTDE